MFSDKCEVSEIIFAASITIPLTILRDIRAKNISRGLSTSRQTNLENIIIPQETYFAFSDYSLDDVNFPSGALHGTQQLRGKSLKYMFHITIERKKCIKVY